MAGLGTSACSGGCSDSSVTVKRWCRRSLDLRWMVEDEEPRADQIADSETEQYHGQEREGEYIQA